MAQSPNRGEIWLANLSPTRGHEQAGQRPVLVLSTDTFNHGPAGLVLVAPLTRTGRGVPLHVPIDPPEGGVTSRSFVLCDAVRSISKDRLGGHAWGVVGSDTLAKIADKLRILFEL